MILSPEIYNKIKSVVFKRLEPSSTNVFWARPSIPEGSGFDFFVYDRGEWQSLAQYENVIIPEVDAYLSAFINDVKFVTEGQLSVVATSGSYNDLTDKPTIPTALSQLSEDTTHRTVSDTEKTTWGNKQEPLVSGTNIKTINNESILGSGNISVAAELPSNLAYTSNDSGEGIVPQDGIRVETVTSAATMTINPDVVTVINGAVGTATITLQVPNDNLAHVWDILMTTDSSVAITFAMSNSETILYPNGFSVGAGKAIEISVIGVGTKYYLRYGEFA